MSNTTVKSFELPHGRSVRVEEVIDRKVANLTLDAPAQGGVYARIASWDSEHARKRGKVSESHGVKLNREAAESLHALLGELLADGTFGED